MADVASASHIALAAFCLQMGINLVGQHNDLLNATAICNVFLGGENMHRACHRLSVSMTVLIYLASNSYLAFGQPPTREPFRQSPVTNKLREPNSNRPQPARRIEENLQRDYPSDPRYPSNPNSGPSAYRPPLNSQLQAGRPEGSSPGSADSQGVSQSTIPPQASSSANALARSVDSPVLSVELVRQRLKDLEQVKDLSDDEKAELTEQYQKALAHLDSAAQTASKVAACKIEAESAPARIIDAKQKLAVPLPKPEPQVPADATLAPIEQILSLAESKLEESRVLVANREAEDKALSDRQASLPKLKADVEQRLETLRKELAGGANQGESAAASLARRTELEAKQLALASELALLDAQALMCEAIVELAPLEDDLAMRDLRFAEKMVAACEKIVSDRRSYESEQQAQEARRKATEAHPALRQIAESNAALAERLPALAAAIKTASAKKKSYDDQLQNLKDIC